MAKLFVPQNTGLSQGLFQTIPTLPASKSLKR